MNEITLKVTLDEANLILEGLGSLPFARVYALVGNIQSQASEQMAGGDLQPGPPTEPSPPQVSEPSDG